LATAELSQARNRATPKASAARRKGGTSPPPPQTLLPSRPRAPKAHPMFVGHYGISYAAKPLAPRVPLWVWFIAVQWLDVVWSLLVLLGVEKVRIVPGFTEGSALDLYYMPYTHSLPGSLLLSLAFGAIAATFTRRVPGVAHRAKTGPRALTESSLPPLRGIEGLLDDSSAVAGPSVRRSDGRGDTPRAAPNLFKTTLLLAAASFSHWLLDLVVHVPDLPLYDDSAKVGLGLWRHVALSFPLELILLGLGAFLYARAELRQPPHVPASCPAKPDLSGVARRAKPEGRSRIYWGFVVFLVVPEAYVTFGPPPASTQSIAITALVLYLVLALLAGVVEHIACRRFFLMAHLKAASQRNEK
jgi:hypothetical protein